MGARWLGVIGGLVLALAGAGTSHADATYPPGFEEQRLAFDGLSVPTAVAFAPDGSVFVAEKGGRVKRFSSVADRGAGQLVIDLSAKVNEVLDRGLLGLAIDPNFATNRRLYVLYTSEQALPGTRTLPDPTFGSWNDDCPAADAETDAGCVVAGKLSRITLDASGHGTETVLIHDWCQQYTSHSIGTLEFGTDGQLYASAGEGANFNYADYGQAGNGGAGTSARRNPCGDPPTGIGGTQVQPTAEGGALRSQDIRTTSDPTGLSGTVIRVNPETGAASTGNPLGGDANRKRIIAHGFRNPYRFTSRPGTQELWVGDVGWETFEEIDRISDVDDGVVENFGWPCYEGPNVQGSYMDEVELTLCRSLVQSATTAPRFSYRHQQPVVDEPCPTGAGSSISSLGFYGGRGSYPARFDGGLFFGDYSRACMWFMPLGADGQPDATKVETFASELPPTIDLTVGPDGDVYFVDAYGFISRLRYVPGNVTPTARITTQAPNDKLFASNPPLTVDFDGRTSSDPDDVELTYAWDLDGDGELDDSTAADPPARTYTTSAATVVRLKVTDPVGGTRTATQIVRTNNAPPQVQATVDSGQPYRVGDQIRVSGAATDAEDGAVPASRLSWSVVLNHCESAGCHRHPVVTRSGVSSIAFTAGDHPWPSYHAVTLTATDEGGLSTSRSVDVRPRESRLNLRTTVAGRPVAGLDVRLDGRPDATAMSPHSLSEGSRVTVATTAQQVVGQDTYLFDGWSNGEAATSQVYLAGAGETTLDARFKQAPRSLSPPSLSGTPRVGEQLGVVGGTWAGSPEPQLAYQWERCADGGCIAIPGATGVALRLGADDVGASVRARVTADNGVLQPAVAYTSGSSGVAAVGAAAPEIPSAAGATLGPPAPGLQPLPGPARLVLAGATATRLAPRVIIVVSCPVAACTATVAPTLRISGRRATVLHKGVRLLRQGERLRVAASLSPRLRTLAAKALHAKRRARIDFVVTAREASGTAALQRRTVALRLR